MVRQDLVRGQVLVAQGGPSDALFIVLHGALAVRRTGHLEPIAELRAGELVGEIGFFANVPRTADVIAIRDTSVLVLTRAAYQKLVAEAPAIVEALLAALARRFAKETMRLTPVRASPKARTVAMIDGGHEPLPSAFDRRLRDGLAVAGAEIVDPARLRTMFPQSALDAPEVSEWLNKLEQPRRWWSISADAKLRHGRAKLSVRPTWSCSRAVEMRPPEALTDIEAFACEVHPISARRLVRIHDRPERRSQRHRGMAGAPALLHASPCRARRSGRYRQPDPFSVRPSDWIRRGRRRQFRIRACGHLQGVS